MLTITKMYRQRFLRRLGGRDTWREPASCAGGWEQFRRTVGSLRDQTVLANG